MAEAGLMSLPSPATDVPQDAPVAFGRLWHEPIRAGLAASGFDLRYLIELETRQITRHSLVAPRKRPNLASLSNLARNDRSSPTDC